jgi:hypothetical protein
MFYSKSTGGFYDIEIHGNNNPTDAVEITKEQHAALLEGQSQGKQITGNENGQPVLTEPTPTELTYAEKREREYPLITDYIDGVVKGDQAQIDKYIADCMAVKAKYPKPTEQGGL